MNNPMTQSPPPMSEEDRQQDEKARRINKTWKVISAIYVIAALGLTMFWEFRDIPVGLNGYIYDLQVYILKDSYYPALDIVFSLILLVVPLLASKFFMEIMTGVKIDNPNYRR